MPVTRLPHVSHEQFVAMGAVFIRLESVLPNTHGCGNDIIHDKFAMPTGEGIRKSFRKRAKIHFWPVVMKDHGNVFLMEIYSLKTGGKKSHLLHFDS